MFKAKDPPDVTLILRRIEDHTTTVVKYQGLIEKMNGILGKGNSVSSDREAEIK